MIVTIDDYRGAANTNEAGPKDEKDSFRFTVAKAGHLKMKLQALNNMLTRTPAHQHGELLYDVILQSAPPRVYVNGAEEVYFLLKHLPWPEKIPKVFVKAYREVLQSRPFTNRYYSNSLTREELKHYGPLSAPTFSSVRQLLPEIDALCNTSLSDVFRNADDRLKPFPFMRLPAELRLQVYDYLVPNKPFVRIRSKDAFMEVEEPPVHHGIMRASRTLHQETSRHFSNKPTLLIEACEEPRRRQDQASFTKHTAEEYATLITGMSTEVRRNFARLEIRIISGVHDVSQDTERDNQNTSPLRQICAALPNLAIVVISFQRLEEWSRTNPGLAPRKFRGNHWNSLTRTLEWIFAQLPSESLRVAWDLTHFRGRLENSDAAQLRKTVMSECVMRELVERNGTLELERSATATREDSQRWSEMRETFLEAFHRE